MPCCSARAPGQVDVQITEDDHLDVGELAELLQVGVADHAGADEADTHWSGPAHDVGLLFCV
jgi:hypothetical protein